MNIVNKMCLICCCCLPFGGMAEAQENKATIKKVDMELQTYAYSNPREYADFGRMYPYHRFNGYAREAEARKWEMVEMENDYIKVWIVPSIGGKIWGAVDKKTGKEFLYFNHVVKFRDVSSRGPWTSGGLEMNFGVIGHSPWCSSQVDYVLEKEDDGSVSCTIGGTDMSLATDWRVKITLPANKVCLETDVLWYNNNAWEKPFYQWMNAGVKTSGDLHYYYPGTRYLTHDGQPVSWPIEKGHNISRYDENDFGHYKSYHVVGNVTDFWGAYWNRDKFGMAHISPYQNKLGKKIWIWGLSRYGMVWEDLLTDKDGQYTELQSGKLFNQSIGTSFKTPFKHFSFEAGASYSWKEFWLPVQQIGGLDFCTTDIAYHWDEESGNTKLNVYAVSDLSSKDFKIISDGKVVYDSPLTLHPTEYKTIELGRAVNKNNYKVELGEEVIFSSQIHNTTLSRPSVSPEEFDYDSAYGLYLQGKEFERQNFIDKAVGFYLQSLEKDPMYAPTLVSLAGIYYAQNRVDEAYEMVRKALSINTYEPKANLLYAQISDDKGKIADAVDGYSVTMQSPAFISVAAQRLAAIYFRQQSYSRALTCIEQSLTANPNNIGARQLQITILRYLGKKEEAHKLIDQLLKIDKLNYVAYFEKYLISDDAEDLEKLQSTIINEYWANTYAAISMYYQNNGLMEDALKVLDSAKKHTVLNYHKAYLLHLMGNDTEAAENLKETETMSPSLVFPNKTTDESMFKWVKSTGLSEWKADYYLGMLCMYFDRYKEAESHFRACGEKPDYYAFYMVRGMNITHDDADFLKAIELAPKQFACYLETAKHYLANGHGDKAVGILNTYRKQDKDNSYINLLLAKAYRQTEEFDKGIKLMKSIVVLPNEGSLESRNIWRESNISYAVSLLKKNKYKNAIKVIEDARIWSENLGVGKPYADSNDERLEDLMDWYIAVQQGRDASRYIKTIAGYDFDMQPNAVSNLFTMMAMRHQGQGDAAARQLEKWGKLYPDAQAYHLAKAIFNDDWNTADRIVVKSYPKRTALPFEVLFDDRDLDLIVNNYDFFKTLFDIINK